MNERINELKRQATIWCDQNIPGEFDENTGGYGHHWEEKFAELIIRNCIEQAHSVGDLRGVNDDMIYGADYAAVQITKYFGVE